MTRRPSWQARLLASALRRFVKPVIARDTDPVAAARRFERVAPWLSRPVPFTLARTSDCGDLVLHWVRSGPVASRRVVLYLHGGAYFAGSGRTHSRIMARLSRLAGVEVCAPDYRLLQQAPFPAALDDALAAWDHLLGLGFRPRDIVLGGDSAGGGLALALLAVVLARGTAPAGLFALSPWTDMTLSGASLRRNAADEVILPAHRMAEVVARYLDGADAGDPRASPLFADFPTCPPVFLQVADREILLDDSLRMADRLRAAGAEVTTEVWPGLPHVWHIFDGHLPEARAALRPVAGFVQTSFDRASR